jgi:hypothetical protein
MRTDKKNRQGRLRFALLAEVGRVAGSEAVGWTSALEASLVREVLVASSRPAAAPNEEGAGTPARR